MQDNETTAAASDPPILIQGGGSINIDVPPGFDPEVGTGSGKKFKNAKVNLVSLQVNTDTPITLNRDDKITITYK